MARLWGQPEHKVPKGNRALRVRQGRKAPLVLKVSKANLARTGNKGHKARKANRGLLDRAEPLPMKFGYRPETRVLFTIT